MIAIIKAKFNEEITNELLKGAKNKLDDLEQKYEIFEVPGAAELVFASKKLIDMEKFKAIIAIGAIIKGDTDHYEYICNFVTQGISKLNAKGKIPVIFGVLTVQNEEQAIKRANTLEMNKGAEFAECAISMINLF